MRKIERRVPQLKSAVNWLLFKDQIGGSSHQFKLGVLMWVLSGMLYDGDVFRLLVSIESE